MNIRSIGIGKRLLFGFGLLVAFIIVFGLQTIKELQVLSEYTERMYNHPLAVSNAVRDIKISTAGIQREIVEIIYIEDKALLREKIAHIHMLEDSIDNSFELIKERYLGNPETVRQAYNTFKNAHTRLDQVKIHVEEGELKKAKLLMDGEAARRLMRDVDKLQDFATKKGDEFYTGAVTDGAQISNFTKIFLFSVVLLSLLIGIVISFSVSSPLGKIRKKINSMAQGELQIEFEDTSQDEVGELSRALEVMQISLKEMTTHAKKIAHGDYTGGVVPRSERDDLAIALNTMTNSLENLESANQYQDWLKSGQNMLNTVIRGDQKIEELASNTIKTIAKYLDVPIGALYFVHSHSDTLKMIGSYAYTFRKGDSTTVAMGEGLVGQCALEKKTIVVSDLPEEYMRITSSLGSAQPRNIILIPFLFEGDLRGVIELGNFTTWSEKEIEFLESVTELIAISFNSAEARNEMRNLLENQQRQSEELQSQQEELRAANEELEEKTNTLLASEERLKNQQEELRATNEELEEKTEFLENQREEIREKNRELTVVRDDIMKKAEELEASSQYKSEFLANMSHELRTPLNSLLILAKDLSSNKGDRLSADDVKSAEIIYSSGSELLQLINEILDLAKIESGKMSLDLHVVKLTEIADLTRDMFTTLAYQKGISFDVTLSPDLPQTIVTDRQKVHQILKNLISNALKFTSEGEVTVAMNSLTESVALDGGILHKEDAFRIDVTDTGVGIAHDKQEIIFEAFKQADGSTSREFGGTGLGLSITKELAALLGGTILLHSETDKGSTFSLLLPHKLSVVDGEEVYESDEPIHEIKQDSFNPVIKGHTVDDDRTSIVPEDKVILIVEDDITFAEVLMSSCRENGFKVVISTTGEEALKLTGTLQPSAIILDVKLPGMSGLQVLDSLKKSSSTRHIPVQVISGDDRRAEVIDKGVIGFLQKPIEKEQLTKTLKEISLFIDKKVKDLLIVEDDENLRTAIEKLIGNSDVVKTSVSTGEEALSELENKQYDCMILDLTLPDISGYEVLHKIEDMSLPAKPPVVIYTGKDISYEEEYELKKYASSIIIKGVYSSERLLDETALFLHRVIKELPENKQDMISRVYDDDEVFRERRILIIDDDMRNVFAVSKLLEEKGMIVEKAANGLKAMEILEDHGDIFDLVLMDIMMPIMDGYETMERIRQEVRFKNLPILALTAKAMKEDRQKCIEAGANDYMTKPIDPERLFSLMRVWLYK